MNNDGHFVIGKVTEVNKTWVSLYINNMYNGFLHISNISDYYIEHLNKIFNVGDILTLEILFKKNKTIYLNFKNTRANFIRNPFEFNLENTKNGYENLFSFTKEQFKLWQK